MAGKAKFFEIDHYAGKQWHLAEPTTVDGEEIDIWAFMAGMTVDTDSMPDLKFDIQHAGPELDFTLSAFDIPVVAKKLGDFFEDQFADCIQRIPVAVGDHPTGYEILNVIGCFPCFDYDKSTWDAEDEDDESCLEVAGVVDLAIDAQAIPDDVSIFRVEQWSLPIVLRDTVKTALTKKRFTGFKFRPVRS